MYANSFTPGLRVSFVSMGGATLGNVYDETGEEEEKISQVRAALELGINYIDTAPWYGQGKSEEILGKVYTV